MWIVGYVQVANNKEEDVWFKLLLLLIAIHRGKLWTAVRTQQSRYFIQIFTHKPMCPSLMSLAQKVNSSGFFPLVFESSRIHLLGKRCHQFTCGYKMYYTTSTLFYIFFFFFFWFFNPSHPQKTVTSRVQKNFKRNYYYFPYSQRIFEQLKQRKKKE